MNLKIGHDRERQELSFWKVERSESQSPVWYRLLRWPWANLINSTSFFSAIQEGELCSPAGRSKRELTSLHDCYWGPEASRISAYCQFPVGRFRVSSLHLRRKKPFLAPLGCLPPTPHHAAQGDSKSAHPPPNSRVSP